MPNPFATPVHPMVVHFPIALLTLTWGCLVLRYATADLRWDERARLFEVVGVLSLAPALVLGFVDARGISFLLDPRFDQPLIWHFLAGITASAAFTWHWAWRRGRDPAELVGSGAVRDLGLATVGMLALLAAGLLGGEMVHGS